VVALIIGIQYEVKSNGAISFFGDKVVEPHPIQLTESSVKI